MMMGSRPNPPGLSPHHERLERHVAHQPHATLQAKLALQERLLHLQRVVGPLRQGRGRAAVTPTLRKLPSPSPA